MTPAVETLNRSEIEYELLRYQTKMGQDLAQSVADELGLHKAQVFKTLIAQSDVGELCVALVPSAEELDLKKLAAALGCRKTQMAPQNLAEKSTGYLKGAISPIGQRKTLKTFIDSSANQFDSIYVSGGKRGVELKVGLSDLMQLCDAKLIDLAVS